MGRVRKAHLSLYAGGGGLERVMDDYGVPRIAACDCDVTMMRMRRRGERVVRIDLSKPSKWHRIADVLDEHATLNGWPDWGQLRITAGIPCPSWSPASPSLPR